MHFELTDEQRSLRDEVRQIVAAELAPNARGWDREAELPSELYGKLGAARLMGLRLPAEHGGRGLDLRDASIVVEELARQDGATALMLSVQNLCGALVLQAGSDAQQQYLPKLASGEHTAAWVSADTLKATQNNEQWILEGNAPYTINAGNAHLFVTLAQPTGDEPTQALLIEAVSKGLHIGPSDDKLGMRACNTAPLTFEALSVSADSVCGEAGDISAVLDQHRILLAALAVGLARGSLEVALEQAEQPDASGQPPAEHQSVQFMLADMATTIDAARLLVRRAAWLADTGQPYAVDAATAKLFASETATKAALDAIQICGGAGYSKDLPIERYLRDAKFIELEAGSSQQQRLNIAQSVLSA